MGGLPAVVYNFPMDSGKETGYGDTEMQTALRAGGLGLVRAGVHL